MTHRVASALPQHHYCPLSLLQRAPAQSFITPHPAACLCSGGQLLWSHFWNGSFLVKNSANITVYHPSRFVSFNDTINYNQTNTCISLENIFYKGVLKENRKNSLLQLELPQNERVRFNSRSSMLGKYAETHPRSPWRHTINRSIQTKDFSSCPPPDSEVSVCACLCYSVANTKTTLGCKAQKFHMCACVDARNNTLCQSYTSTSEYISKSYLHVLTWN